MFQFSIREVLLLILVAALALGWFVDRDRIADENERLRKASGSDWAVAFDKAMKSDSLRKHLQKLSEDSDRMWSGKPNKLQAASDANVREEITKQDAVEIVREMIAQESGGDSVFDCNASETSEGYRVFVIYGAGRDTNGHLIGLIPGGHSVYVISKTGEVVRIIPGA